VKYMSEVTRRWEEKKKKIEKIKDELAEYQYIWKYFDLPRKPTEEEIQRGVMIDGSFQYPITKFMRKVFKEVGM